MSTTVLDDAWELTPADRLVVEAKRWGSRLRFAVLLLFYRARGRFPRAAEVDRHAAAELARAPGVPAPDGAAALLPDSDDRTLKRQRAEIRALLGFREATVADAEALGTWLRDHAAARTRDLGGLTAEAEARCRALRIEPPTPDRIDRVIRAAVRAYDERRHAAVRARLSPETRARLDALPRPARPPRPRRPAAAARPRGSCRGGRGAGRADDGAADPPARRPRSGQRRQLARRAGPARRGTPAPLSPPAFSGVGARRGGGA